MAGIEQSSRFNTSRVPPCGRVLTCLSGTSWFSRVYMFSGALNGPMPVKSRSRVQA